MYVTGYKLRPSLTRVTVMMQSSIALMKENFREQVKELDGLLDSYTGTMDPKPLTTSFASRDGNGSS